MTDLNSTLLGRAPFVSHCAFTLWRLEDNPAGPEKKPLKVPVHYDGRTRHSLGKPARHGRPAVPGNPAPPMTAEQAAQWLKYHRDTGAGHDRYGEVGYIGAGFRPMGTGLVCIDADDCVVDGKWTPAAEALMARFPGAMLELSVSGKGLHIWVTVTGEPPGKLTKQITPLGELEIYSDGQFIAQGQILAGDASTDHTEAVAALVREFWPVPVVRDVAVGGADEWETLDAASREQVIADLRSAFPFVDQSGYHAWQAAGAALYTLGEEVGNALWHELSELWPGYDYHTVEAKWPQLAGDRTSYKSIFTKAEAGGWVNNRKRQPLPTDASEVFAVSDASGSFGTGAAPAGMLLEPPPSRQVATSGGADLSFMGASQGLIAATVASVETALLSAESGVKIAYDAFKDRISISIAGSPWRPLRDTDYGRLRAAFERRGFKPVPAEAMSTAVAMVAEANQFDSAIQWAEGLTWDGVPRIDTAMPTYYGTADTPYTRAAGAYLFTALAGRCLVPGIKADMAIIFVGLQGAMKTSSIEVLCPEHESFGEVDLNKRDTDLARQMRGKLIIELAELNGLAGRDQEAIKAWISRRKEEWTPKYKEMAIAYWRRCVLIGTDNKGEFLDDPTGARRFVPLHVGSVDLVALARDRDQLWAEGIARFRASGIAWQDAERLARDEHHKFEVVDELQSKILHWLESVPAPTIGQPLLTTPRSANPIHGHEVLSGALNMAYGQIKKTDEMRLAKIMRKLGYQRVTKWIDGGAARLWAKVARDGGNV